MFQFKFGAIHIRVVQMVFSGIHTDRTTEPVYFGKQKIWDLAHHFILDSTVGHLLFHNLQSQVK